VGSHAWKASAQNNLETTGPRTAQGPEVEFYYRTLAIARTMRNALVLGSSLRRIWRPT
jgi:hypothetical protein